MAFASSMRKETMFVIFVAAGLFVGLGLLASLMITRARAEELPMKEPPASGDEVIPENVQAPLDIPPRMTLEGEFACLRLKDIGEDELAGHECVYALKTDDGKYYILDTALSSAIIDLEAVMLGERIKGNGIFIAKERLSTDRWQAYNMEGIFAVTNSFEHEMPK